jgi:ABC-2 type transport system ATP-binding protein
MTEPVLTADALTKQFGQNKQFSTLTAINRLSFSVDEGEMFCLVGPDGAGKTTLLRLLCGILRPTSGTARILGYDIQTDKAKIKPLIGYLSQKFSLYGDLSIDENIDFFAEIHGVTHFEQEKEKLLEFTRLKPFRKRLAEKLSGGMKQKLALACTLIHTPRLLFLDEPTTGVDPVSRRDFWLILSGLLENGLTIVLTTPYLDEAERGTRVGFLNQGELLKTATPQQLKNSLDKTVVEIVCDRVRAAYKALQTKQSLVDIQLFGDRLNLIIDDQGQIPDILAHLAQAGIAAQSWRIMPPRLENIFIALMPKETPGQRPAEMQQKKDGFEHEKSV